MIATNASSEHTRSIGRWRMTRAESSFSLCSRGKAANEARGGALRAEDKLATSVTVNEFGKRQCKAEIIWGSLISRVKMDRRNL